MTPLRQKMIEEMTLRNLAPQTQEAYLRQVEKFARHFGRSPEQLGPDEIRRFQIRLVQQKVSWSTFDPFGGPRQVLRYLGRYTHRVAISNDRLVAMDDRTVTFRWKDYKDHSRQKLMTLEVHEFIRRFLIHVLPERFVRIRHFGFLANRHRAKRLALCRGLLAAAPSPASSDTLDAPQPTHQDAIPEGTCPSCRQGHLRRTSLQPILGLPSAPSRLPAGSSPLPATAALDSS